MTPEDHAHCYAKALGLTLANGPAARAIRRSAIREHFLNGFRAGLREADRMREAADAAYWDSLRADLRAPFGAGVVLARKEER